MAEDLANQIQAGQKGIAGVMLESFLVEGRHDYDPRGNNTYGQSITDACIGLDESKAIFKLLANAVKARRKASL